MEKDIVLKERKIIGKNEIQSIYKDGKTLIEVDSIFSDEISLEDAFFSALSLYKYDK